MTPASTVRRKSGHTVSEVVRMGVIQLFGYVEATGPNQMEYRWQLKRACVGLCQGAATREPDAGAA